jgi:hypothetical protein
MPYNNLIASVVSDKKMSENPANQNTLLAGVAMLNFTIWKKPTNYGEDHPRNIPATFGSIWPSGF